MTIMAAILFGLFLAYANGANDNFKGVATLFGSGTTGYKKALGWATVTTLLGSLTALALAQGLIATFSGRGLVPDQVAAMKSFAVSVALAAALTVMLATRLGFPISTTHALTGALVGTGWLASSTGISLAKLGSSFFLPLIVSPFLAVLGASAAYPLFRFARSTLGIEKETCLCAGTEVIAVVPQGMAADQSLAMVQTGAVPSVSVGTNATCRERYSGSLLGIDAGMVLDASHFLSAGVVSFARGLNDTPKIAALLLAGGIFSPSVAISGVAVAIALGGLVSAKRVAETMSHRVTTMNPGQGFTANLITGVIVIFASHLGMPISTTHVSCGALFGIGAVTKQARWKTIAGIFAAWLTTVPVAAVLGAVAFLLLSGMIA